MAYFVSLYLWLLFIRVDPLFALVVPALHSLQYLTVVWRYQLNYENAQLATPACRKGSILRSIFRSSPAGHMSVFVVSGAFLGFVGFWAAPLFAQVTVGQDEQVFTGSLFLFVAWVFINVHHTCSTTSCGGGKIPTPGAICSADGPFSRR